MSFTKGLEGETVDDPLPRNFQMEISWTKLTNCVTRHGLWGSRSAMQGQALSAKAGSWSAVSGQWSVVSGHWGGGESCNNRTERLPLT